MILGPSNTTGKVDSAFIFILVCGILLLAAVTITMVAFLIKYNREKHPRPERVKESALLEVIWTVIPTILVIAMFYFGWVDFEFIRNPPKDALTVNVTARQWSWLFTYDNGRRSDVLNVPLDRPVKLLMTSADVLHCLFIPAYRIKEDCVPGMTTHLWFTANEPGTYDIFCTEYCGVGHSHMRAQLIAMKPEEFQKWYNTAPGRTAVELGVDVLRAKGCLGCHSLDGSAKVGPTFKGLLGRKESVVRAGKEAEIVVDEAFIRQHILDPQSVTVKGFPPVMPVVPLTAEELGTIVNYLVTLK